jgi:hypothetical protein
VTRPAVGVDSYHGYYAGISAAGRVVLGRATDSWTQLGSATVTGASHRLRVTAIGPQISVYVDDMATPKISVTDATHASGATGLRVFNAAAAFDNVAVGAPVGAGTNVAQGRPATGSTPCVAAEGPDRAVNGSVTGGGTDKFCSSVPGAWLQVDLGGTRALTRFEVAHAGAGGEAAAYNTRAFTISVSNDGTTWTPAVTVTANTLGETTHPVSGVSARYVRLAVGTPTQNADGATRIYELRAFA